MNTNNILCPVLHETHSDRLKASPCTSESFPDPRGHFPHKKPKNSVEMKSRNLLCLIKLANHFSLHCTAHQDGHIL